MKFKSLPDMPRTAHRTRDHSKARDTSRLTITKKTRDSFEARDDFRVRDIQKTLRGTTTGRFLNRHQPIQVQESGRETERFAKAIV